MGFWAAVVLYGCNGNELTGVLEGLWKLRLCTGIFQFRGKMEERTG